MKLSYANLLKYFPTNHDWPATVFLIILFHAKSQDLQRKSLLEELLPRGFGGVWCPNNETQPRSSNPARSRGTSAGRFPVFCLLAKKKRSLINFKMQRRNCVLLQLHRHHCCTYHPLYAVGWCVWAILTHKLEPLFLCFCFFFCAKTHVAHWN